MNDRNAGLLGALSKTGCRQPLLISWGARALYIGPAFKLAAHRNAVAVLAVGLDDVLGVARDPAGPEAGFDYCRTALIAPNQLHLLDTPGAEYAFLYVDALSHDLAGLRSRCRRRVGQLVCDLDGESALIAMLGSMDRSAAGWHAAGPAFAAALGLGCAQADFRVRQAAAAMLASPAAGTDAAWHAAQAGLSSSRFQHVFKQQTGVSFRRYRIWARLQATMDSVMSGKTLTEAAYDAGFASSAHLSATFKAMFGMSLTKLLSGNVLYIRTGHA